MSAELLDAGNYYKNFEHGGWDMEAMCNIIEGAQLPAGLLDPLRAQDSTELLVLGSATARNIDKVAKIDRALRPGQGHKDHALIIDYNSDPLDRHARKLEEYQHILGVRDEYVSESGIPPLSYPRFSLKQADMRDLPLEDGTVDVAMSDYTFNFLPDTASVQAAFDETARVLRPGGLILLAVDGNSTYRNGVAPTEDVPFEATDLREMHGGINLVRFPLSSYLSMAEASGLELRYAPVPTLSLLQGGVLQRT
jgi:SAM-dependent methyltransferase